MQFAIFILISVNYDHIFGFSTQQNQLSFTINQIEQSNKPITSGQPIERRVLYVYCNQQPCYYGDCINYKCQCPVGAVGVNCEYDFIYFYRHFCQGIDFGQCCLGVLCSGDGKCSSNPQTNRCCSNIQSKTPQYCQIKDNTCKCQTPYGESCSITGNYNIQDSQSNDSQSNDSLPIGVKILLAVVGLVIFVLIYACRCNNAQSGSIHANSSELDPQEVIIQPQKQKTQIRPLEQFLQDPQRKPKQLPPLKIEKYYTKIIQIDPQNRICSICLDAIDKQHEKMINCPSKHTFHQKCISEWLKLHKTCPECRAEVRL